MDTFLYLMTPVIGTATIIVLLFVIGATIHFLLTRTEMGARIKNRTPWMGWYEDADPEYTNFRIHPDNYIKVPTPR